MRKYAEILKIIFPLLLLLLLSSCKENTVEPVTYGSIQGIVYQTDGKTPIADAQITTNPASVSIVTDNTGKFSITNVPTGNYAISASKTNYNTTSVSVSVQSGVTAQATILLSYSTSNTPGMAVDPSPKNQASNQSVSLKLSWQPPAKNYSTDTVKYDVYLFNSDNSTPQKIASKITDTAIAVTSLKFSTTYFWQVVTRGTDTAATYGTIWSFTTQSFPNNPYVFARIVNGNYQIFSSDSTIANTIQLTNDNNRNWYPRFNPMRDEIAFTSNASVQPQIYTMNLDGTNVKQVTTTGVTGYGNYGVGFCWSPNGSNLLYAYNDKLYKINSDGSGLTLIAAAPAERNFRDCSYSPDGSKIVALTVGSNIYDSEIYTMNSDGSNMSLVIANSPGATASPSFSVDGQKILYTHDVSGYQDNSGRQLDAHIFEYNISTKDTVDLSTYKPDGTNDLNPRYSPNGAYVIFDNGSNTLNSQKDIWILSDKGIFTNGTNRQKILSNGIMPDWK
jgi:TolB protein